MVTQSVDIDATVFFNPPMTTMARTTRPPRDFGSKAGMKAFAVMMRLLPRFIVYATALIPVAWYFATRKEARAASARYQQMLGLTLGAFGRFWFGLRQAAAFSRVILDNMYLGLLGRQRFKLDLFGTQVFLDALDKGKGLILLSAHVGNWHLAVNYLGNTKRRVHLVIDDVRLDEVRRQMDAAKLSASHLTVHDAREGLDLMFRLKEALAKGEVVILAGDRITSGRKSRLAFLGGTAWFPTTAFHLAQISKAPVCTALAFRTGMQRYSCYGIEIKQRKDAANPKHAAQLRAQDFADQLGDHVRRFPTQWFNFYDFWGE